jgi:hypothetical protein
MNSLLLLNGSPRGERSNPMRMLSRVVAGWEQGGGQPPEVLHLAKSADFARAVEAFADADVVLLGMPLYTDAMPSIVKFYIEAIGERAKALPSKAIRPTLGFLVQCGFPEALHIRYVERYLAKVARRLALPYAGTIVRGGGGMLDGMPDEANKKLWQRLRTLGEQLARDGCFSQPELTAVNGIERIPRFAAPLLSLAVKLHLVEFMWNGQLKKNGVWERRFAAPYGPAFRQ